MKNEKIFTNMANILNNYCKEDRIMAIKNSCKAKYENFFDVVNFQRTINLLFLRASHDLENYKLRSEDKAYEIFKYIYERKVDRCPIRAIYMRSDYIHDIYGNNKLVEYNLAACSQIINGPEINRYHSQFDENIKISQADEKFITFVEQIYILQEKRGIALMVDSSSCKKAGNYTEKKIIIEKLAEKNIVCFHISIQDLLNYSSFADGNFYFKKRHVFLIYYRYLYNYDHYTKDLIDLRIKMESSTAVSLPSIEIQILNLKIYQPYWLKKNLLKNYIENHEILEKIINSHTTYKYLSEYGNGDEKLFILKTYMEGGESNIFRDKIKEYVNIKNENKYFLMRKIDGRIFNDRICEVGIFGGLIEHNRKVVFNEELDYIVRSKWKDADECCITKNLGFLDSLSK